MARRRTPGTAPKETTPSTPPGLSPNVPLFLAVGLFTLHTFLALATGWSARLPGPVFGGMLILAGLAGRLILRGKADRSRTPANFAIIGGIVLTFAGLAGEAYLRATDTPCASIPSPDSPQAFVLDSRCIGDRCTVHARMRYAGLVEKDLGELAVDEKWTCPKGLTLKWAPATLTWEISDPAFPAYGELGRF